MKPLSVVVFKEFLDYCNLGGILLGFAIVEAKPHKIKFNLPHVPTDNGI